MSELSNRVREIVLRKRRRSKIAHYVNNESGCRAVRDFCNGNGTIQDLYNAWSNDDLAVADYARVFPLLIARLIQSRQDGLKLLGALRREDDICCGLVRARLQADGVALRVGTASALVPRHHLERLGRFFLAQARRSYP